MTEIENSRFQYAVGVVLDHEGGISANIKDPGGITKWGISLRFLRLSGIDVDDDGEIDAEDIISLTKPEAIDIYQEQWWLRYRYNDLYDLTVATKVFDMAVNMGAKQAHKLLQIAINRLRVKPIKIDGVLGFITLEAANRLDPDKLVDELRKVATHFYVNLVADKPELKVFLRGWKNRAAW